MTRLERIAGWCLWITVWYPIITIFLSFQPDVSYSYFITYRKVVFVALLIQCCATLAVSTARTAWFAAALALLAILHNPLWIIHLGSPWPWRVINTATVVLSFTTMAHLADVRHIASRVSEQSRNAAERAG